MKKSPQPIIIQPRGDDYWKKKLKEIEQRRRDPSNQLNAHAMVKIERGRKEWESRILEPWVNGRPERKANFTTASGIALKSFYGLEDCKGFRYLRELGFPGGYPYTRGVYPTMYRGRPWTVRMFSGFGMAEDTNRRLRYLLNHGETGLSVAFDLPTLYGYDADHPAAEGEVGRCGMSVSSLRDMEGIFKGIPLDKVSTSMTINAPAAILTCMYIAVGEKQGIPQEVLKGTVQTDILKEYIAQNEWVFPPEAHMRIIRDLMVYCFRHMPYWNCISISGYHIREAGATAVQELAFTLADGFTYVDLGLSAGLGVDEFAPRLSFFFNACMDFFEEIAKFRAARRIWATVMRERYNAQDPRSLFLRFHAQTSDASLTWQQPMNNIVRTAIEALAAVLGGTQSLHTNSYDEAWALPTEEAAMVALRTQQIIAEESNVANVIDPLGGSYYVEWLTSELEERAYRYFDKIEELGGVLEAVKSGYFQREIAQSAYSHKVQLEKGGRTEVGVNKYIIPEQPPIRTLRVDQSLRERQGKRLRKLKAERDNAKVKEALQELRRAFESPEVNCIYPMLKAIRAYATLGEIMDTGRAVFGGWKRPPPL